MEFVSFFTVKENIKFNDYFNILHSSKRKAYLMKENEEGFFLYSLSQFIVTLQ